MIIAGEGSMFMPRGQFKGVTGKCKSRCMTSCAQQGFATALAGLHDMASGVMQKQGRNVTRPC